MKIGEFELRQGQIYFIAEASANHCQDFNLAKRLVIESAAAGADAVKFQTYTAKEIAADGILLPRGSDSAHDEWLENLPGRQTLQDLLSDGGLPREWHAELRHIAKEEGIEFLSTPFSIDAARFLIEDVGVPAIKVASGDMTFHPLLDYLNSMRIPTILSTGGAFLSEVIASVEWLRNILLDGNLAILHCVSIYPCHETDTNLLAIATLTKQFPESVIGFSDHTVNCDWLPVVAALMGADIIEKHVKLGNAESVVDGRHSVTTWGFSKMVRHVNEALFAIGNGRKVPQAGEMHDRLWARRDPSDWLRPTEQARNGRWA